MFYDLNGHWININQVTDVSDIKEDSDNFKYYFKIFFANTYHITTKSPIFSEVSDLRDKLITALPKVSEDLK